MQRYNQLRLQGVPDTDPEFLKCRKILAVVRQKQSMDLAQKQAAMRQRQQEMALQNGSSAGQIANGMHASSTTPASALMPMTNGAASAHSMPNPSGGAAMTDSVLSEQQAHILLSLIHI